MSENRLNSRLLGIKMKETFLRLPEEKRLRVIHAGINEFGSRGYEHGSLDRIVELSKISKGGLYEYISSKEEFFLYLVDFVYSDLYRFLEQRIDPGAESSAATILDRLEEAARHAVDYYFESPDSVRLLERNIRLEDAALARKVIAVFENYFDRLFHLERQLGMIENPARISDLLRWILLKTRSTFLLLLDSGIDPQEIRKEYLEEWSFHLTVLKQGIFIRS